ncbi:hypothetical protein [Legionella quateirensis]|uniref:Periplasmic ligand-binding sensor domain protein n=1 Tax=Legionella quateirensis TaxID=45072 RepID=A0A378L0C0_9GAMM|nr:hypothetical protein [Legionella quateirensis]KTD52817.1 periplasmic ligand-binding sensor domain protein [Legionella quateirensis]STY19237.1 periplasmic ligand-binding sensor domain protein [Legionella quateirensis]
MYSKSEPKAGGVDETASATPAQGFASNSKPTCSFLPSAQMMYQKGWDLANFTSLAFFTSASIVAAQGPFKAMLLSQAKNGTLIPLYSGGVFGLLGALYRGTSVSLSGSAVRTVYVTGAKSSKPIEEGLIREEGFTKENRALIEENKPSKLINLAHVMSLAAGEVVITQIPESLSQLKKVPGLLPDDFKWNTIHNSSRLLAGGFTPRYALGVINFASLCVLEDQIANKLPIKDECMLHFTAGALSGVFAAGLTFPLAAFKDGLAVRSTVVDGKLYNKSTFSLVKEFYYRFNADPKLVLKEFGKNAAKQLPLRMGLNAVIFSLVAGVGKVLGPEPLERVVPKKYHPNSVSDAPQSFFSSAKASSRVLDSEPINDVLDKPDQTGPI